MKTDDRFHNMIDKSFGTWYEVTYIPSYMNFRCPPRRYQEVCCKQKMILDNVNGYGMGTVFFITQEGKMLVLDWAAIVMILPIEAPCELKNDVYFEKKT